MSADLRHALRALAVFVPVVAGMAGLYWLILSSVTALMILLAACIVLSAIVGFRVAWELTRRRPEGFYCESCGTRHVLEATVRAHASLPPLPRK